SALPHEQAKGRWPPGSADGSGESAEYERPSGQSLSRALPGGSDDRPSADLSGPQSTLRSTIPSQEHTKTAQHGEAPPGFASAGQSNVRDRLHASRLPASGRRSVPRMGRGRGGAVLLTAGAKVH